jgi:hypothetical protein
MAPVPYWPQSRPLAPLPSPTTSQTVTGIVTRTFETVKAKYALARSSSRKSAVRNSNIVKTQSPKIAIRIRPASECPSKSLERGSARGRATARPIVVVHNSEANDVFTTWPGSSPAW